MKVAPIKKQIPFVLLSACTLLFSVNCSDQDKSDSTRADRIELAVQSVCKTYEVQSCSYVITSVGKLQNEHFDSSLGLVLEGKHILESFTAPLYLRSLIKEDSEVGRNVLEADLCGDSLLQKYIPKITNKTLTVNDLIRVPADQNIVDSRIMDSASVWIRSLGVDRGFALDQFVTKIIGIETKDKSGSVQNSTRGVCVPGRLLLKNLAKVSLYFDRENVTDYRPLNKDIPDPYPTWYVHNLVGFAGWQILRFEKHVVLWQYISSGKTNLLLLKGIDRPFFTVVAYPNGNIPSPDLANLNDVLLSPFATSILQAVYPEEDEPKSKTLKPDFLAKPAVLRKQFDVLKNRPYNFLYFKQLLSHALFLKQKGDRVPSDEYFELYENMVKGSLPREIYSKQVIASMNYIPNNCNESSVFKLDTTTKICIQALTQKQYGTDKGLRDGIDAVEFHFGISAQGRSYTHYYHTLFRGYDKIDGVFDQNAPASFTFKDVDDTSYVVMIRIPWANIGVNSSEVRSGMRFKFDVILYDNDIVEYRKSVLSWFVQQKDNLQKPDSMGEMVLSDKPRMNKNRVVYCPYQEVDARKSLIYIHDQDAVRQMDFCPIKIPIAKGTWSNNDNSGGFKSFWNKEALYFFVDALDNIKNTPMYLFPDKAYIEKVDGGSIWKAMGETCLANPIYLTKKELTLPAGTYRLWYKSDRNHSFEQWVDKTPALDNYGLVVWKTK